MDCKIIDISFYQGNLNWDIIKSSYQGVIIKSSQYNWEDTMLRSHIQNCIDRDIPFGLYHYYGNDSISAGNGTEEAKFFLQYINEFKDHIRLMCFLDIEASMKGGELECLNYLIQNSPVKIGIYSGEYFYRDNLAAINPGVPIWIANYSNKPNLDMIGWQYSCTETIDGIDVDHNVFNQEVFLKKQVTNNNLVGGIYKMEGSINMRAKYRVNGVDVWTRWYDMDKETCDPYKNITGIEIYTELPLKWGVCMNQKYINVEGSGIIEGAEVYGFQAYLTDQSKKTYYWVSSPGDVEGYEWWANNCKKENIPAVCENTGGCSPLNAIKLRLG